MLEGILTIQLYMTLAALEAQACQEFAMSLADLLLKLLLFSTVRAHNRPDQLSHPVKLVFLIRKHLVDA